MSIAVPCSESGREAFYAGISNETDLDLFESLDDLFGEANVRSTLVASRLVSSLLIVPKAANQPIAGVALPTV